MTHRASARAARAPNYTQYVFFDLDAASFGIDQRGPANTTGAEPVRAASRYQTAEWGSPDGGVPAVFGKNGRRWPFPEVRSKPGAIGTSASAPHVAAVAARILDQRERYRGGRGRFMGAGIRPRMPPTDVKPGNIGGDIGPQRVDNANGFDFDTGFGFVDAQRALRATRGF